MKRTPVRTETKWADLLNQTFDGMSRSGPKALLKRLCLAAEEARLEEDPGAVLTAALLRELSPVRAALQAQVSTWDYALRETWSTTPPNTIERRREIASRLALPPDLRQVLDAQLPPKTTVHREFTWVDAQPLTGRRTHNQLHAWFPARVAQKLAMSAGSTSRRSAMVASVSP